MKKLSAIIVAVSIALGPLTLQSSTVVPGHQKYDRDNNGFPDAGVYVNGHYTSVYIEDASGKWYWDLGDGRIMGDVSSPAALDQTTLTRWDYNITYRADFNNNAYMDRGWIRQNIVGRSYLSPTPMVVYYLIVHKSDPRYTGDPQWRIWGDWEYFVLVESGAGNLPRVMRPDRHSGG